MSERIGPYAIEGELGRGGMGVVYRARHAGLDRAVALKVLTRIGDPEALARFLREMRISAGFQHPNLVRLLDAGEDDGIPYLAMELIEGGTLDDQLRVRCSLPWAEALAIGSRIAEALDCLHGQQILHRDLKPGNILLAADGTVKLADFGLARVIDSTMLTGPNTIVGTPAYMAPELLGGQDPTPDSDLWAVGCILFEMLAGRHPFPRSTPEVLFNSILSDEPMPVHEVDGSVPPSVSQLVGRLLEKIPGLRKMTAAALRDELDVLLKALAHTTWQAVLRSGVEAAESLTVELPEANPPSRLAVHAAKAASRPDKRSRPGTAVLPSPAVLPAPVQTTDRRVGRGPRFPRAAIAAGIGLVCLTAFVLTTRQPGPVAAGSPTSVTPVMTPSDAASPEAELRLVGDQLELRLVAGAASPVRFLARTSGGVRVFSESPELAHGASLVVGRPDWADAQDPRIQIGAEGAPAREPMLGPALRSVARLACQHLERLARRLDHDLEARRWRSHPAPLASLEELPGMDAFVRPLQSLAPWVRRALEEAALRPELELELLTAIAIAQPFDHLCTDRMARDAGQVHALLPARLRPRVREIGAAINPTIDALMNKTRRRWITPLTAGAHRFEARFSSGDGFLVIDVNPPGGPIILPGKPDPERYFLKGGPPGEDQLAFRVDVPAEMVSAGRTVRLLCNRECTDPALFWTLVFNDRLAVTTDPACPSRGSADQGPGSVVEIERRIPPGALQPGPNTLRFSYRLPGWWRTRKGAWFGGFRLASTTSPLAE